MWTGSAEGWPRVARRPAPLPAPCSPSRNALYVLSTIRRAIVRIRLTMMKRNISGTRLRARRHAGMCGLQAVERALGGGGLLRSRSNLEHLLPRVGGALEILLAERLDDADVQKGLCVLR